MADSRDGVLLMDKNEGETSFNVVRKVRRVLAVKKVGHAGTLDPFATGLLVILVGQGTKLSPFLMGGVKLYRATIRLGMETDTMDPTGRIVKTTPVAGLEPGWLEACARRFVGEIEQVPPVFSAVKVQGRRAYDLARKGIRPDLEKRTVTIYRLDVEAVDLPDVTVTVACSGGTYIRSLAADLGRRLGTGAHLKTLRRLGSGSFTVDRALDSGTLESPVARETLEQEMIPLEASLPDMQEVQVDEAAAARIRQGYQPQWEELRRGAGPPREAEGHVKIVASDGLVAVMKTGAAGAARSSRLKAVRIFHPSNPY
jgi:tRNA pseudouridine55 synthase